MASRRLGLGVRHDRGMRIDSPGLVTDLELLRLQGSTVTDHGDHLVVRTEANPTFWWGNFVLVLGEARSAEVDRWVARFEEEFPDAHHRAVGFAQRRAVTPTPGRRAAGRSRATSTSPRRRCRWPRTCLTAYGCTS